MPKIIRNKKKARVSDYHPSSYNFTLIKENEERSNFNNEIQKLDEEKNTLARIYGLGYWNSGVELENNFNENCNKLDSVSCIKARKEIVKIFDLSYEYYKKVSNLSIEDREELHHHLLKTHEELADVLLDWSMVRLRELHERPSLLDKKKTIHLSFRIGRYTYSL